MNKYALRTLTLMILIAVGVMIQSTSADAAQRKAYFAGGCFWCVESDFEKVKGVSEVVSGFIGGKTDNPTYKQVTKGGTGHYEAVEIRYNDSSVSYDRLLYLFFRSVDPTDAGGQFCDPDPFFKVLHVLSQRAAGGQSDTLRQNHQGDGGTA